MFRDTNLSSPSPNRVSLLALSLSDLPNHPFILSKRLQSNVPTASPATEGLSLLKHIFPLSSLFL